MSQDNEKQDLGSGKIKGDSMISLHMLIFANEDMACKKNQDKTRWVTQKAHGFILILRHFKEFNISRLISSISMSKV